MKGLCYSAKLVSGLQKTRNPEWSRKFGIISSKISGARATLRLIDDIPMIKYALDYGLGFQVRLFFYIPFISLRLDSKVNLNRTKAIFFKHAFN